MASMHASRLFASRERESPAMASGSISYIGSMPTQIGAPLRATASSNRSAKFSFIRVTGFQPVPKIQVALHGLKTRDARQQLAAVDLDDAATSAAVTSRSRRSER